jgi:antirestriction protein ArdC
MAAKHGYEDPRWITYNQSAQNGWHVRKGEKGTQIEFWDYAKRKKTTPASAREAHTDAESTDKPAAQTGRGWGIRKIYTVFNARQVDGIPAHEPKQRPEFEVVQTAESILTHSGARIQHDQNDRAFYNSSSDSIHLPPKAAFPRAANYYGTALHELAHWSGAERRLNRKTLTASYRFGDQNYAKEELRAELASVFLAAERGIPHDPAQHAGYLDSWIKVLRADKNEIFGAAKDAHAAADYLLSLERQQGVANGKEQEQSVHRREATEFVARFEPQTDSVTMQQKATATERRTPATEDRDSIEELARPKQVTEAVLDNDVHQFPRSSNELGDSFASAQDIARQKLGDSARTYVAQTDSGVYRGEVVAETDLHVLLQLNARSAVAHLKHLLSGVPAVGESVVIRYSDGSAQITALPVKSRGREIGR